MNEETNTQEPKHHYRWMCDVIGKSLCSEQKVEEVAGDMSPKAIDDFVCNRNNLTKAVRDFIVHSGYRWTDSGGGAGGWHLGVPFDTLEDATKYVSLITEYFQEAIATGLLRVKLMTWTEEAWRDKP